MNFQNKFFTRRQMLQSTGMGMGAVALAGMLGDTGVLRAPTPPLPRQRRSGCFTFS